MKGWNVVVNQKMRLYSVLKVQPRLFHSSFNHSIVKNEWIGLVSYVQMRSFHVSSHRLGPKNKKSKQSGNSSSNRKNNSDNEDDGDSNNVVEKNTQVTLPNVKDIEKNMVTRISRLEEEYKSIRGGKASVDMFNHLKIEVFGSRIQLVGSAQVTLQSPTRLNISVFDSTIVNSVADAIKNSGMNIDPSIEGNNVIVNIPKSTSESKELLLKTVSKMSEKTKQEIRQIRKDAMDSLKKIKSTISEDDSRKFTKDIENTTEKLIEKVSKLVKDKESEIQSY